MKKIIPILILIVAFLVFYKFLSVKPTSIPTSQTINNPDLIFYFGETCPHCKKVEDYISSHQIDQKLKIQSKEVYNNKDNQKDLENVVSTNCPDLNQSGGIGVPVLFNPQNKQCFQGDQPIIDYLTQITGQSHK